MKHLSIAERLGMAEARGARLESRISQQEKLIQEQSRRIDALIAALRDAPAHSAPKIPQPLYRRRMADIAAAVALGHDLTLADLKSDDRTQRISWPRQEAMVAMQEEGFSLPQIGRFFGRDHTTILHGVRAVEKRRRLLSNCDADKIDGQGGVGSAFPCPRHSEPTGEVRAMPYDGKYPISARVFNPEQTGGEA